MPDDVAGLCWSEEQWAAIRRTVQEAAGRARIASSFLPLVGPLPPGQATVPALVMQFPDPTPPEGVQDGNRLVIDDTKTLPVNTISCLVYLTTQQVEDPELASAKELLGRAAGILGRLEDAIIFNGHPGGNVSPQGAPEPAVFQMSVRRAASGLLGDAIADGGGFNAPELSVAVTTESRIVIQQVDEAIWNLEQRGHYGPFACVLGRNLYRAAIRPESSLAIPRDRILALLQGGPLHRSSVVPENQGVVVSLAASPIDLVVASDVHVKLLQVTVEPRYVFRISERFVLRVKQPDARCVLVPA